MNVDGLVDLVVGRVTDCYKQHDLCCSESVMVVLNRVFGSGLSDLAVVQMASGFCHGLGGAGCCCGALSGSEVMLSLFLGPHQGHGLTKTTFRKMIRGMHDDFRQKFGSTCCRVLSKKVKHDGKSHRLNCLMLTQGGVELATHKLLLSRPDLAKTADIEFLKQRTHPICHSPSSST